MVNRGGGGGLTPLDHQPVYGSWLDSLATLEGKQLFRKQRTAAPSASASVQPRPAGLADSPSSARDGAGDVFGGNGLFDDIHPVFWSMALFGMLPITFGPVRLSAHPFKSTVMYCALVTALVLWSLHNMARDRYPYLHSSNASNKSRFSALLCLAHASGLLLLLPFWVEVRHLRRNRSLSATLMKSFGHVRARGCRRARVFSWLAMFFGGITSPISATLYLKVVAPEGGHWSHLLIHSHVLLLVFVFCSFFGSQFLCLQTFAKELMQSLSQELSQALPSARRVAAHRLAWLQLRDLLLGLVTTPMTLICCMMYMLLMMTLGLYLSLVCLLEGQYTMCVLLASFMLFVLYTLIFLCDSVQRAAESVGFGFLALLETYYGSLAGDVALEEINIFRGIVAASCPITVSAWGFMTIDRGTVSTMLATCVSYLIVLVQFRDMTTKAPQDPQAVTASTAATAATVAPAVSR